MSEADIPSADPQSEPKGSLSAPIGMVALILLGIFLAWNDTRAVGAVNSTAQAAASCQAKVKELAAAATPDAQGVASVREELEGIVASGGGAAATPLFETLGRESVRKAARDNYALALALLTRLEVLEGDLPGVLEACGRFEGLTKNDYVDGDVEVWVWRARELAEHPKAKGMDRAKLWQTFTAEGRIEDLLKD